jgi:hypothetical protein
MKIVLRSYCEFHMFFIVLNDINGLSIEVIGQIRPVLSALLRRISIKLQKYSLLLFLMGGLSLVLVNKVILYIVFKLTDVRGLNKLITNFVLMIANL